MSDRALLASAACCAAVTAAGAVLSARADLPGEPLGVSVPGRVGTHLAYGLGSAISAPWPMPVAVLLAAARADGTATWPGRVCVLVGSSLVAGTLVEPVTWNRRPADAAARATVPLNLLCGLALVLTGRRALGRRR